MALPVGKEKLSRMKRNKLLERKRGVYILSALGQSRLEWYESHGCYWGAEKGCKRCQGTNLESPLSCPCGKVYNREDLQYKPPETTFFGGKKEGGAYCSNCGKLLMSRNEMKELRLI